MVKGKRLKKRLLIAVIVAAVLFVAWSVNWFVYKWTYFDRVIKNNPDFVPWEGFGQKAYVMYVPGGSNPENHKYTVVVYYPEFLRGSGNYCLSQSPSFDDRGNLEDDYCVMFSVKPHLFDKMDYYFDITDYTNAADLNDGEEYYHFRTNEALEVTAGDREKAAELFDKAEDEISGVLAIAEEEYLLSGLSMGMR